MAAGRPKSIDNSKVFDVAKPGKSKPVSTSRPVIVNHSMAVKDASVVNGPGEKPTPMQAPSAARKVIKPISISGPEEEKPAAKKSSITIIPEPKEETAAPELEQAAPETVEEVPTVPESVEEPKEAEPTAAEETETTAPVVEEAEEPAEETETGKEESQESAPEEPAEKPEETPPEPEAAVAEPAPETPTEETKPEAEEAKTEEPETSESASVDALAEASEKPKVDQKVIEEEAKKEAALQQLIDSKKYVVPLAHDSTKSSSGKGVFIALLVVLLLAAGAYIAIDAKILKVGIDLPYHFFKQ